MTKKNEKTTKESSAKKNIDKKKNVKKTEAMDLDQLKNYTIELTASKAEAQFVEDIIAARGAEGLNLPPIPIAAIKDFVDGKRNTLWDVTLNGKVYIRVKGAKEAAEALLSLMTGAEQSEFNMEPLPLGNLNDYIHGKRGNVAQFEMVHNPVAKPKEALPGHLG